MWNFILSSQPQILQDHLLLLAAVSKMKLSDVESFELDAPPKQCSANKQIKSAEIQQEVGEGLLMVGI